MLDSNKFKEGKKSTPADKIKKIESIWQKLSGVSEDESMRVIYAKALIRFGDEAKAETFIRKSLNQKWSNALVAEYGHLTKVNTLKALQQAESWVDEKPGCAQLLLTCGRLSQQQKLWGKAKDYYQSSIDMLPSNEAIFELSLLLNAMGEKEASQALFIQSLSSLEANNKLPLP